MTSGNRLNLALRRNAAKARMSAYLAEVSRRLERPVAEADVLNIVDTDQMREAVDRACALARSAKRAATSDDMRCSHLDTEDRTEAARFLAAAVSSFDPDRSLWLMAPGSEICGAIRGGVDDLTRRGLNLARDDEEAVRIASGSGGPAIRFYADTVAGHAGRRWTICTCITTEPTTANSR